MNYTTLQSSAIEYLHRSDLASLCPTFVANAEAYLFRELHIKELQVSATVITTGGYAPLPSDFGSVSRLTLTKNGRVFTLDYSSVPDISTAAWGYPKYYALENNQLRIFGSSDADTFTLYYIPKIEPLGVTVSTNWLLDNAQDLYMYATALEGAKHIRDESEIAKLQGMIPSMLDSVKRYAERRGQPATGSLQIKPRR